MKRYLLLFVLLAITAQVYAQEKFKVRGVVLDNMKEPITGATIIEADKQGVGTITDLDGNFELNVSSPKSTLKVTFIGYKPIVTPVNGKSNLTIVLQEDVEALEEVVVTGYGGSQLR